jgi:hypothetical protein
VRSTAKHHTYLDFDLVNGELQGTWRSAAELADAVAVDRSKFPDGFAVDKWAPWEKLEFVFDMLAPLSKFHQSVNGIKQGCLSASVRVQPVAHEDKDFRTCAIQNIHSADKTACPRACTADESSALFNVCLQK